MFLFLRLIVLFCLSSRILQARPANSNVCPTVTFCKDSFGEGSRKGGSRSTKGSRQGSGTKGSRSTTIKTDQANGNILRRRHRHRLRATGSKGSKEVTPTFSTAPSPASGKGKGRFSKSSKGSKEGNNTRIAVCVSRKGGKGSKGSKEAFETECFDEDSFEDEIMNYDVVSCGCCSGEEDLCQPTAVSSSPSISTSPTMSAAPSASTMPSMAPTQDCILDFIFHQPRQFTSGGTLPQTFPSTCFNDKAFPNVVFPSDEFKYEIYRGEDRTFQPSDDPTCIRVNIFLPPAFLPFCEPENWVMAAYEKFSFDPSSVASGFGYLGDSGRIDNETSLTQGHGFSFLLPPNTDYEFVVLSTLPQNQTISNDICSINLKLLHDNQCRGDPPNIRVAL